MLRLIQSNALEALSTHLLDHWQAASGDALDPEVVIVPSRGVARWLTWRIADRFGVCADVDFRFAAEWLWSSFGRCLPGVAERSPFGVDVMTLRLLGFLASPPPAAAFAPVRRFLHGAPARRRLELAQQIASVFDGYLVFRPDWLSKWSAGRRAGIAQAAAEDWQMRAWKWLEQSSGVPGEHPSAAYFAALAERRARGQSLSEVLPARLRVFALPTLPPLYADIFARLGEFTEVDWYVLNPSRAYWADIRSRREVARLQARGDPAAALVDVGHDLLASWGRQAREQSGIIAALSGESGVLEDDAFVEPAAPGLLGAIQRSMLELEQADGEVLSWADDDQSIQLHDCHSLTRQVEVLHDNLLHLFDADASLRPSDVVVFATDLEQVAGLVDAVFGAAIGERRIPYQVTGRERTDATEYLRALWFITGLPRSRFDAASVLAFLSLAPVARRYGFDEAELPVIRRWLREAGVRWGLHAAHRARLELPATSQHTWQEALSRLLLGFAMPAGGPVAFAETLAYTDIEGSQALALGKLVLALRDLVFIAETLEKARGIPGWVRVLLAAIERLLEPADDEVADDTRVRAALDGLVADATEAGLADDVELEIVEALLEERLTASAPGSLPTGRVTVSSIGPLRGLPYRVVCFVGLDDKVFPRPSTAIEFDLMPAAPRPGDRARRMDDRQAFLDGLLAAREILYVSFDGHDIRDNAVRPPSILVSELVDHVARRSGQTTAQTWSRLVRRHALQAFSARYFDGSLPRSFAPEYLAAARALGVPPHARSGRAPFLPDALARAAPAEGVQEIELERLMGFFHHPVQTLLRRQLGLRIERPEEEVPLDEPFELGNAERWKLERELLRLYERGLTREEALVQAALSATLPHGAAGDQLVAAAWRTVEAFAHRVEQARCGPLQAPLDLRLPIASAVLTGRIERLDSTGIIDRALRRDALSDVMDTWIRHLALGVVRGRGGVTHSRLVNLQGCRHYGPVDDAAALLADLVDVYREGQARLLALAPKSALKWLDASKEDARMSLAERRWRTDFFPGECEDVWLRLAYGALPDAPPDGFQATVERVLRPLLRHALDGPPAGAAP